MRQANNHREKLHLLRRNVMNHAPTFPCIALPTLPAAAIHVPHFTLL
ncbi:hypothetical protein [Prevotella intermedia]|nr:hypothetical protein [Prevotella intermedia]